MMQLSISGMGYQWDGLSSCKKVAQNPAWLSKSLATLKRDCGPGWWLAHTWNPSTQDTETEEHILKTILGYIKTLPETQRGRNKI